MGATPGARVPGEPGDDPQRYASAKAVARRYLGAAGGDRYVADNPDPVGENVVFRMRPERWLSQDQGKAPAAG